MKIAVSAGNYERGLRAWCYRMDRRIDPGRNRHDRVGNNDGSDADKAGGRAPGGPPASRRAAPKTHRRGEPQFPWMLYGLLEDAEMCGFTHVVSWLPCGRLFHVHNRKVFLSDILPLYVRQSKYKSFMRSLNLWGFITCRPCCGNERKGAYFHPNFRRGSPPQISDMVRIKIKQNKEADQQDDGNDTETPAKKCAYCEYRLQHQDMDQQEQPQSRQQQKRQQNSDSTRRPPTAAAASYSVTAADTPLTRSYVWGGGAQRPRNASESAVPHDPHPGSSQNSLSDMYTGYSGRDHDAYSTARAAYYDHRRHHYPGLSHQDKYWHGHHAYPNQWHGQFRPHHHQYRSPEQWQQRHHHYRQPYHQPQQEERQQHRQQQFHQPSWNSASAGAGSAFTRYNVDSDTVSYARGSHDSFSRRSDGSGHEGAHENEHEHEIAEFGMDSHAPVPTSPVQSSRAMFHQRFEPPLSMDSSTSHHSNSDAPGQVMRSAQRAAFEPPREDETNAGIEVGGTGSGGAASPSSLNNGFANLETLSSIWTNVPADRNTSGDEYEPLPFPDENAGKSNRID